MSDSFPPVVHQFSPSLNWLKQVARPQSAPQDNAVGWLEEGWSESHGLLASTGSWEEPAGGSSPEKVMSVSCLEKKMLVQVRKDVLEVLLRRDPGLSISSNGSETSLATGEQTEQIMQRFEFTCMYVAQPSPLRTPPAFNRALVRLKAYTSDSFLQQCRPCIVPTNSWVFVEAVLQQSNPQISFSIQLCRISPSSDPMVESNFIVVRDTCPVDPSVTFFRNQLMEDHQVQEVQRFAFQLRPAYNESIQFLHCQLALCFKEGLGTLKRPWDAPKCLPQDSACTGSAGGIEPVNGSFLRIISKPMIVTMGGVMESVSRVQDSSLITGRKTKHLQEPAKLDLDRTHAASQQEVDMGAVVGIAVSAFIIGAFLISGLWFIYCQTDPRRTFRLAPLLPLTVEKPQKDSSDTGSPQTEILRGTLNSL
uniref:Transforming growth factor-beta receptor type 3-like protein isoform X2 n=1 Tax=Geotrypetes seraphini TaxID=260995 RepID=A0A6P8Q1C4_GEOSA|nr:transforming growth factor-beta receptor type 3-like protein isoform X2 [Geotrypetes seraphini]